MRETELTFAFGHAAGVQVSGGGSRGAGLALHLTLLVLVGAEPAAGTLTMFHREVSPHWTLDCIGKVKTVLSVLWPLDVIELLILSTRLIDAVEQEYGGCKLLGLTTHPAFEH